ncbi:MAG: prolyl oligopeptidase family serine peptidase, partial [Bdellovibrionota bacterium]
KLILLAVSLVIVACSTAPKTPESAGSSSGYKGHGAESVAPEVLARFAPPSLPAADAEKIRKILEVQAPGVGRLSPDGKTLYFSWGITGTSQIFKIDKPLGFPEQLTSGADRTSLADVTNDGKFLIVQRDRAGEENPGLYLMPSSGGPLVEIQHVKGVQTNYLWSSMEGDVVFFRANDVKPDSYVIYSYDVATKKKEALISEPGLWFIADVVNVGGTYHFLVGRSTGALTAEYSRFSLKDRKLVPVLGQGEKEEYRVEFAPDANGYFVMTNKFGNFHRLYRFRDGKFDPLTPDVKMDLESFEMPYNKTALYLHWNDEGATRLEVLDPVTMKPKPFPKFENASHVFATSPSRMGRFVAIGVEHSKEPRTSFVYDWKEGKLTQWVKPSFPELPRDRFADTKLEFYPARDGTKIPMLVTRPKECEGKVCPVVVHFHGGPEGQSRPGFNRRAQLFVSEGFIYVDPNVRGSEGYGKAWLHADDGPKRLDVITDIEDCSKYIRSAWAKDGKTPKVGVMGWSYGGYSTFMAMTMFAGSYDAGVALVGMSSLRSFLLNTAPYRRILRASEYGDPEKDKDALEKLSAMTYLDRVKAPLMISQGASDPRVPVGEAVQMHMALEKRGVESPLIIYADEGHGSAKRDNSVLELGHTIAFFRKHLK